MRTHAPLLGLAALTLAATGLASAWPASAQPVTTVQDQEHEEEPLHEAMEHIKPAVRRLGKLLGAGELEGTLELVSEIQRNALIAKSEVPELAEGLEGEAHAAYVSGYRAMMIQLMRVSLDLEEALLQGRAADAQRIFQDQLRPLEKAGHAEYRDKE